MNHARIDLLLLFQEKKLDFMFKFVHLAQQHKQLLRKVVDFNSKSKVEGNKFIASLDVEKLYPSEYISV